MQGTPPGLPGNPQPMFHAQPQPQTKGSPLRILRFLPLLLGIGIPLAFLGGGGCTGSVEGEMKSTGEPHGDFTLTPTSCFSGEHESFFGVWVTPDLQEIDGRQGFKGGLKIVRSHTGEWEVYVESPKECDGLKCKIRQLDESECKTFEVDVRNTNTTINDIRVREGRAKLDCKFDDGTFTANLKFSGCS